VVASVPIVYSRDMDSVVSSGSGSRWGSQDETGPFPLELEIVNRRKRVVRREGRSQDETAPFPRELEVVARKAQQSQDESSPFLLEFTVILSDGEPAFVRTARPPRARSAQRSSSRGLPRRLPRLKWQGADASRELREYAARIASGEKLPPYRGPILANGERPETPRASTAGDSKAFAKLTVALLVMSALVVAAAVLGDDARLSTVGQSIRSWLTGRDDSFQSLQPMVSATTSTSGSAAQR
jgi:hypothetical protein